MIWQFFIIVIFKKFYSFKVYIQACLKEQILTLDC